jgi:very-short-patch-repair endonuclease
MDGMPDHDALRILTARQHGAVSRRQLADLGFTNHAVAHALAIGQLRRASDRVLLLGGSSDTIQQRTMAAALDVPSGAVAVYSCAALWRAPGFRVEPVHVLTTRRPHRGGHHLGVVHSTVRWAAEDVTELDGVPVTTPIRTLRDLAGRIHPEKLSLTCDRWLSSGVVHLEDLHALAADLPTRGGARGTQAMRRLIAARPPGYRPVESGLERRFESILAEAGDAPFERQVDLGDDDGWIGRVDFLDRVNRVVVEVQSDLYHAGLVDRARDRDRMARLRRAGWTVIEVTEHEVWYRKDIVLAKVRSARADRRAA